MDMAENTVLGFQFEPTRENSVQVLPYDEWETESGEVTDRTKLIVSEWCKCGVCIKMTTSKECKCCKEMDITELSELCDKRCITELDHFFPIVLMKGNLWTELVGMHDRENSGLPSS
ncbi:uncharacterized protein LOC130630206 [Hydractinia symbiolongicarpus]|uniref:uncharacterized protein LOC130630206 n=1 Tax=Hydractinia symbiolongicarpus TaxID=13093 RepID=UPI00254FAE28|nr:uncharacterized protein LOC130630206 [Hydractinia symbiolongicarpus]